MGGASFQGQTHGDRSNGKDPLGDSNYELIEQCTDDEEEGVEQKDRCIELTEFGQGEAWLNGKEVMFTSTFGKFEEALSFLSQTSNNFEFGEFSQHSERMDSP